MSENQTASSINNLDISTIESSDLDQLTSKINSFYKNDGSVKTQLAYHWDRNQMMLDGKQWLQYDGSGATNSLWSKVSVSKANEYIPRPVTNYLFDVYQTLKSYLIKNKPRSKVFPNNPQDHKDKIGAELATLCCEANWVRLKEQYNYETAASNVVTYGTVFKKDFWDTSSINLVKIPRMEQVPSTDPMTGAPTGAMTERQAMDPMTGDPLWDEVPIGDVNTKVVEPQRIALDPLAMHLHDAKWIMEYSIQTLDWITETYSKEEEGYTGLAKDVKEDKDLNGSMRLWFQAKNSSGVKDSRTISSLGANGSSDTMVENSAVVKEYYEAPSSKHPKGRMVVIAGDKCVYAHDSPYSGPELGDWHPYSECRWELTPGRFWGKGPLDDAVEVQKKINSIDSVVILNRKTMAIPQKSIPQTVGIAPGSWTGRPGQEVYWRPDGTGAKPETIPGIGVDPSVFQERAQSVSDLKEMTGAIDILRGDRPPGVNAASALSLLYEVGTGKLYPILDRWKAFVEASQKKQLRLIHNFYKEPRPDFIRLLKAKNKDLSETEINQFLGTDLQDNCNVVIEAGSNIPKLEAAKQSLLLQLAQLNMLNLQDPTNRSQFQKDMGIIGYDADVEPDQKRAMWENSVMDDTDVHPESKPVVLEFENHALHKMVHENRMKSPTFLSVSPAVQAAYLQHIQQHEQFMAMQQQAAMLNSLGSGMPPAPGLSGPSAAPGPAPAPASSAPHHHSPSAGPTKEMKNSLAQDALVPAAIGGH